MNLLIQFLLRLSFGLAAGMAITSSKTVTSGYFRNHLYVTLGLTTLAAMVSYSIAPDVFWYCCSGGCAELCGVSVLAVRKVDWGHVMLLIVVSAQLAGACVGQLPDLRISRKPTRSHAEPICEVLAGKSNKVEVYAPFEVSDWDSCNRCLATSPPASCSA